MARSYDDIMLLKAEIDAAGGIDEWLDIHPEIPVDEQEAIRRVYAALGVQPGEEPPPIGEPGGKRMTMFDRWRADDEAAALFAKIEEEKGGSQR